MSLKGIDYTDSKKSLKYYKPFFESSPISITLLNLRGEIVEINSATEELSGLKRNELVGKSFTKLPVFPPKNLDYMIEIFKKLKKGELFGPKDIQIRNKYGNVIWINIVGSLIKIGENFLIQVLTQDITSRKRLEQDLENSEENYRILAENANDLIIVLNSEFMIEYINEKVHRKIMGYDKVDLLGRKGFDLVHPEDLKKVSQVINTANKDGEGSVEARIRNKNGEYIWIETNGKIVEDKSGKVKYLLIGRDITERKSVIKELQEFKDQYQNLANSLPQVIFDIDLDYNITYTNTIASKKFGYSIEEFNKKPKIFQFLAPEDEELVLEKLNHLVKGEYIEPLVVRLRRKDGSFFYANIYARRIFKNKNVIGVRSIIHDITGLKEAQEKLIESEDKFRTIAEQSLLGVCIIQDEVIKYVNHILADLLDYSIDEILNWKQGEFFKTIHPKDKKKVIELANKNDSEFKNGIRYYEARGVKKNGEVTWFEVYYKKILYQKKSAFLISFLDINQRKKAQEKLKDLNKMRREFIDRASHELKIPITTIYGAFQLLDQFHKHKFDDDTSAIFEIALSGTKQLKKLVDSLLDLSRLEAKMFKLEKSNIDLTNLIKKCVNGVKYLMKSRNQTYDLALPNSLHIDVDDSRIELVLNNLLTNAIKYTPTSGKISIKLESIENYAQISVRDTGIGLTKVELNKLFKKFSKIQTPLHDELNISLKSTGLGLHIAKEIVKLHGGEIWAESEGRNKGSTFLVKLPNM
ncbi:MAG: PAS domain S-box protein [Promethearchaeota archaeon]